MFSGYLKVSTARNVDVLMVDSGDHITGKTGRTLSVFEGKNAGAFATCSVNVTERSFGHYQLALGTGHADTKGDYCLYISATSCDPSDYKWQVVTDLPGDSVASANVSSFTAGAITNAAIANGAISSAKFSTGAIDSTAMATGAITAAKFAAGAIDAAAIADGAIDNNTFATSALQSVWGIAVRSITGGTIGTYTGNTPQTADVAALITTVGVAGAGLTAINLPDQTMNITGNITGNLSGSVGSVSGAVGSVTGAVGSVTGNVGGNVTGSVGSVVGDVGGNVVGSVGSVTGLTASNLDATISSRMATYTQPTGFLAATFPNGTIANTTNITAGIITTTTNLTNLPATAALEATSQTILGQTGTTGVVVAAASKSGYALSSAGVTAVWAEVMSGATTAVQAMRGFMAALLGKGSGLNANAPKYRDIADTKDVIDAVTDSSGNRTTVNLDLT